MQFLHIRLPRWLRRWFRPQKTMESEMQHITRKLIRGSIGRRGTVRRAFAKQSAEFNPETNPIGKKEAMNILVNMVKLSVAERSKLEGTVIDRVERGMLYSGYTDEVERISDMAATADEYYRSAEAIREDYLVEYGFYMRNRMESFRPNSKAALSDEELAELEKKIERINKSTGLGGGI